VLSFSPGYAFPLALLLRMTGETINVNFTLSGEYVVMYRELKARGLGKGSKDPDAERKLLAERSGEDLESTKADADRYVTQLAEDGKPKSRNECEPTELEAAIDTNIGIVGVLAEDNLDADTTAKV